MFLIENHHRETIRAIGDPRLDAILPSFIPYNPNMPLLTDQQQAKLWRKWRQSDQGVNYSQFLAGVQLTIGCNDAVTVQWCGMWLCIETDGSCHT